MLLNLVCGENMKLNIVSQNKYKIALALLAIFSVFVCLSCISAADNASDATLSDNSVDDSSVDCIQKIPCLPVAVSFNSGTGYHWEISPETYGATLMTTHKVLDNPGKLGSSGTMYFNFFIPNKHDFFIKLVELDPNGDVVDVKEVHAR